MSETTAGDDVQSYDDDVDTTDTSALLSRLRLIEDQPLETRAGAFAQIHEELQTRLENGDSTRGHA